MKSRLDLNISLGHRLICHKAITHTTELSSSCLKLSRCARMGGKTCFIWCAKETNLWDVGTDFE